MGYPLINDVLSPLGALLKCGALPSDAQSKGALLHERLQSPIRIAVIGLSGAGKSCLISFLSDNLSGVITSQKPAAIGGISVTKVALSPVLPKAGDTAALAYANADIVLWCSQEFSDVEQAQWASAPEDLKDRSLLVLTKADSFLANKSLTSVMERLQKIAADEFHSFVPMATLQAISACPNAGAIDEPLLKASGGRALLDTINNQVELGCQADLDQAQLFLKRFHADIPVISEADAVPGDVQGADIIDLSRAAIEYVAQQTVTLTDIMEASDTAEILEFCNDTAIGLADIVTDELSTEENILALQGDLLEAADVMLLLEMEASQVSAADAVTLLLQLTRDLTSVQAA
ncbi:MAG: hypothetical protein V3U96_02495 [Paracoccaceae bacterium]